MGSGGHGGSLGGTLAVDNIHVTTAATATGTVTTPATTATVTEPVGQLNIVLPSDVVFDGTVSLVAGDGGNGFTTGGTGGNITGTTVAYAVDLGAGKLRPCRAHRSRRPILRLAAVRSSIPWNYLPATAVLAFRALAATAEIWSSTQSTAANS